MDTARVQCTTSVETPFITFYIINVTTRSKMLRFLKHPVRLSPYNDGIDTFYAHTFHIQDVDTDRRVSVDSELRSLARQGCIVYTAVTGDILGG
jgi:hypothetical protein